MKFIEFKKKVDLGILDISRYNAETVFKKMEELSPHLGFISSKLTNGYDIKQIKALFGINDGLHTVLRKVYPEYLEAIQNKHDIMKLKSELDVQKGVVNSEYKNPKILEMQLHLYNEDYKPKQRNEVDVNLPTTLEVVILDSAMEDEELEEFAPEI